MKELKFICPSCGQHIQCDCQHAGENVPCPSCAVLVRVPLGGEVTDVPDSQPESSPFSSMTGESETVSYTRTDPAGDGEKESPGESAVSTPVTPLTANPTLPTVPNEESPARESVEHISALHCVCPVCQSELRISVEPESPLESLPTAVEHLPAVERARQVPAARRVSVRPAMKPRLDRILNDSSVVRPSPSPSEEK